MEIRKEDFEVDPTALDPQLCNLGQLMLSYGELETELRFEVESRVAKLDKYEADLDDFIRSEAKKEGEKLTEAKIKNQIISNKTRLEMVTGISEARKRHNMLRWAMKALEAKRDCLLAISYRERQLMKADRF